MYWDLGGNYLKYELPSNKILTKIDHLPFSAFDYGLLHRVLLNKQSALANYTLFDLNKPTKQEKVDGVTGATPPKLKGSFVPGALYTSYTLWHIVYRQKITIQQYTSTKLLNSSWTNYLLENPELGGQQLALNYLILADKQIDSSRRLSTILDTADNELAMLCIDKLYESKTSQQSLTEILPRKYLTTNNNEIKAKILTIWSEQSYLTDKIYSALVQQLGSNSSTIDLEIQILNKNQRWPDFVYYSIYDKVKITHHLIRREKLNELLLSRANEYPKKFKKLLKKEKFISRDDKANIPYPTK